MKQRTTTRVSTKDLTLKASLICAALLMSVAAPLAMTERARASRNQYDEQMAALRQQINGLQSQADQLGRQATTLANKIRELDIQKAAVEAQISLSQSRYDQLAVQITETNQKIQDNKDALGTTVADLYIDDNVSQLEMLASSLNIGEYIDKQTYRESVQDQLNQTIARIKELKIQLEKDQAAQKAELDKQTAQRNSLIALQQEQQRLLTETRGQEAAYQQQVANSKAQLAAVEAEMQAALARVTRNGAYNAGAVGSFQFRNFSGNMGCSGGYPYCVGKDAMVDPWGLYSQECVSYSAWRAVQMGKRVGYFSGRGNAYEWPSSASGWMGAVVNNTPAVGAVAILPITPGFAPIGHSMNVEAILGDGWVRVSQFNFGGTGEYSTMDIQSSGVVFIHFPNR